MNRKEIVLKLSEFFGVEYEYLGVPSFAYEVTAEGETYNIDREGIIKNSQGKELTLDEILNGEQSEEDEITIDEFEVKFPFEGHTGVSLKNIVNMLSSKQKLIIKSFGLKEDFIAEGFAEELNKKEIVTIEDFKTAFIESGTERCKGLTFDFEEETFLFKLMGENLQQDKMKAFEELMALINKNAKILKRTSFKPVQDDNEKFAFRTWIIRLGMKGKEYKDVRKTLLSNLEGNCAFRKEVQ